MCCADVTCRLLRLTPVEHASRFQQKYWAGLSDNLTELSLNMDGPVEPIKMGLLTQLTNLTSLRMYNNVCHRRKLSVQHSYVIEVPRLKRLYISDVNVTNLTINCPALHTLDMSCCKVWGRLLLQAPLENFSCRGYRLCHVIFPLSSFFGLTRLRMDHPCTMEQDIQLGRPPFLPHLDTSGKSEDRFYGILPLLSNLRILDLIIDGSGLPPHLPTGLESIKYVLRSGGTWSFGDCESLASACQLPELQSITVLSEFPLDPWQPTKLDCFRLVVAMAKATVIVREIAGVTNLYEL